MGAGRNCLFLFVAAKIRVTGPESRVCVPLTASRIDHFVEAVVKDVPWVYLRLSKKNLHLVSPC